LDDNNQMDLGDLKSREIGTLITKTLVDLGKEAVNEAAPTEEVDYGNLPSRALPVIGKHVVANMVKQEEDALK